MSLRARGAITDAVIAVVIFIGSAVWGTTYFNRFIANGGQPEFYQNYFEPAVMVACGKGFVITQGRQIQPLEDFLQRRRDDFQCSDLTPDIQLGTRNLYQGAWIYLQQTVGWFWWINGISWSRMGPLFGLLFGISTTLAYGIFRLGMGRILAVAMSSILVVAAAALMNLPNLRDYAKAPFTLALVFIVGLVVTRRVTTRSVLALSAAFGIVLGIGYGFRTDFLASLPVWPIVIFAFLDDKLWSRLWLKAGGVALFLAMFLVVSWPALNTVYKEGGCQWHVTLLGLQSPFDEPLRIAPAPYDFGYAYSDGYIAWTVEGYAHRMAGLERLPFCSHEYDVQSGAYLKSIAASFPGDMITRAFASVIQITELPFLWWAAPIPNWLPDFYEWRASWLRPTTHRGVFVVALAILIAATASIRLSAFLVFFLAYFGGYPMLQFQTRHHFHLEFITWWAVGFVLHHLIREAWGLRYSRPDWTMVARRGRQSLLFGAATLALALASVGAARWYQHRQVTALIDSYVGAEKVPLNLADNSLASLRPFEFPQLLQVDLDQSVCAPNTSVTFRYNTTPIDGDLSRTITLDRVPASAGLTRVFHPAFKLFRTVEVSDATPGCVKGVYRLASPANMPMLLSATVPPDWSERPRHQRLRDWELGALGRMLLR
ncbi:MAG TPA: hypothetical protein VNT81_05565 [Vicinamibacterales bacterium]|nr:hypothetical protein [Vicinamibacterales bacterium]